MLRLYSAKASKWVSGECVASHNVPVQASDEAKLQHANDLAAAEAACAEAAGEWNSKRTQICEERSAANQQCTELQDALKDLHCELDKAKVCGPPGW